MPFKKSGQTMPQFEAKGEADEVRLRIESLLTSSGLQVLGESQHSLRFRKVKLSPSGNFPLSIYGSGEMELHPTGKPSTLVTYNLNISPVTVFSFAVTGLSIFIFAAFIDYFLLISEGNLTSATLLDILFVSGISLLAIITLVLSFAKTKRRAEKFLRAALK